MSPEELNRRAKAVKLASSINKIEGVPVSPAAELLFDRWARGEITGAELKATVLATHQQL